MSGGGRSMANQNGPDGGPILTQSQPTVEWASPAEPRHTPEAMPEAGSGSTTGPSVRLWLPRDVGIASFLLGFPGGFGIIARNAWRIGRRGTAFVHLLAAAGILLLILFLPIPRQLGVALNFGIAYALYSLAKRQVAAVTTAGGRVERAPGLAGVMTFAGGWLAVAAPVFILGVALGAFGPSVNPGTMQFGTGGSGCSVDAPLARTAASGPLHYVAYLSRNVRAGETIKLALSEQAQGHLEDHEIGVDSAADCVNGTIPGGTLTPGTYMFEFTVGAERVAAGAIELTP